MDNYIFSQDHAPLGTFCSNYNHKRLKILLTRLEKKKTLMNSHILRAFRLG